MFKTQNCSFQFLKLLFKYFFLCKILAAKIIGLFDRISSSLAVMYFISIVPEDKGFSFEYNSPFEGNSTVSVGRLNLLWFSIILI